MTRAKQILSLYEEEEDQSRIQALYQAVVGMLDTSEKKKVLISIGLGTAAGLVAALIIMNPALISLGLRGGVRAAPSLLKSTALAIGRRPGVILASVKIGRLIVNRYWASHNRLKAWIQKKIKLKKPEGG